MPQHVLISDSESDDYSETDISMELPRRVRAQHRRRSVSRHRYPEVSSTSYLAPQPVVSDVRIRRSHSTGRRRRDDEVPPPPPQIVVDIRNDARNKGSNTNKNRKQDAQYINPYESEEEFNLRPHRRPRASTSVSREGSPHYQRDYDLLVGERLLERNDQRQDLELMKHKLEIERLGREVEKREATQRRELQLQQLQQLQLQQQQQQQLQHHHSHQHEATYVIRDDDDDYDDELNDRLRRLQQYEKKQRLEEERRQVEYRFKLKRLEEAERANKEQEGIRAKIEEEKHQLKLKRLEEAERMAKEKEEIMAKIEEEKLKEMRRKLEEDKERERIKKEIKDEELKALLEKQEREKKEEEFKKAAIAEFKLKEEKQLLAEREAKEKKEQEFKARLKELGYSDEEIEKMTKGKKEEKKQKQKEKEEEQEKWIKVHRKYLLPDTLLAYHLPWQFDEFDGNYIIIKQWIPEDIQEELFAHTRRIREGKLVTETSNTLTELKVNDKKKDKMFLVRKKSPSRRSWIFT